jgi:transcriptional regulator with XRE-family HTH domain
VKGVALMPRLASTTRRASADLRQCVLRARSAADITQESAALDLGVSVDTIQRWESGSVRPDVAKLLDAPKLGPFFSAELEQMLAARRAVA